MSFNTIINFLGNSLFIISISVFAGESRVIVPKANTPEAKTSDANISKTMDAEANTPDASTSDANISETRENEAKIPVTRENEINELEEK